MTFLCSPQVVVCATNTVKGNNSLVSGAAKGLARSSGGFNMAHRRASPRIAAHRPPPAVARGWVSPVTACIRRAVIEPPTAECRQRVAKRHWSLRCQSSCDQPTKVRVIDLRPPADRRLRPRSGTSARARFRRARRSSVDRDLMTGLPAGRMALRSVFEWSNRAKFAAVGAAARSVARGCDA